MMNVKKIAMQILAYEEGDPEDKGGLFHIYEQDENTIVIEFAKRRTTPIAMRLTRYVGKVAVVPPVVLSYLKSIKKDVKGSKFYVYMGIVTGIPEFPVYVISEGTKPYATNEHMRLVKPVKIVGTGKSKKLEQGVSKKMPKQLKETNILY